MSYNLYGKKAIIDAIKNKKKIDTIFCIKVVPEIQKMSSSIKFKIVDKSYFKDIDINHQFIMATVNDDIQYIDLNYLLNNNKKNMTLLILDEIEDPLNFGAIIRTSAAFNIDAIIYKKRRQAPVNNFVIKTSMGGIQHVMLCEVSNINYAIEKLKENKYWIYGTSLNRESLPINKVQFTDKTAIVMGNENHGINNLTLTKCDECIFIPMTENIQSLNVSVATGIILYKRFNDLK